MAERTRGRPPYDDNKLHVMADKCNTCVFRPGNLMTLEPGRLKDLVQENVDNGAALTCHKTTFGQAEQEAICRGFFETQARKVPALRLALALDIVEEV